MPKPYSVDLRARVIEEVETGASRRAAAGRALWDQPERGDYLDATLGDDRKRGA